MFNLSKKTLIITGGHIDFTFAKQFINDYKFDYIICADHGLVAANSLLITPNAIVGDFDSADASILEQYKNDDNIYIRSFKPEKDYTDTEIAVDLAIEIGSTEVVILGATGSRIDHMLANIGLLIKFLQKDIAAYIIDKNNKLYLINKETVIEKEKLYGEYISLIPITDIVMGVTLKGFKYPLNNHKLVKEESLGISNEIIEDVARISMTSGTILVIEAQD